MVNGRVGTDGGIGSLTCKNSSVVDYAVVSYDIFALVEDFAVLEFDNVFSDVHCPIELMLVMVSEKNVELVEEDISKVSSNCKFKWKNNKKEEFVGDLNANQILDTLDNDLNDLLLRVDEVSKDDMNTIVKKINRVLLDSAEKFGMRTNKKQGGSFQQNNNKPWFNEHCKKKKKSIIG
jgi:hypothetical protein